MEFLNFLKARLLSITFLLIISNAVLGIYFRPIYQFLKPTLPLALFVMLYPMMIGPDFRKAEQFRENTKYIGGNLFLNILIGPLLIYCLVRVIPIQNPAFVAGMVLIAIAPMAGSAAAFTGLAGGNVALTMVGVALTFLISIVTVPLYMKLLVGALIEVPVVKLLYSILIYVVIPLVFGQFTRALWIRTKGESHFKMHKEILSGISMIGMYWMVVIVFGLEGRIVLKHPSLALKAILVMGIFYLILFLLALLIARLLKFRYAAMGGPFTDMWMMILSVRFLQKLKSYFGENSRTESELLGEGNLL